MKTYQDLVSELEEVSVFEAMATLEDEEYLSEFDVTKDEVKELYNSVNSSNFNKLITERKLDNIATYMDDEIREQLHGCDLNTNDFLNEYLKKDSSFASLLDIEFGIRKI